MIHFTAEKPDVLAAVRALQMSEMEKLALIMERVGYETIAYLRSLTNEMRPPARVGGNSRRAHPGHWADVTSQLANSYTFEVESSDTEVRLILRNDAEHAIYVEAMDGFFVLSGVADPNGPVEQALRRIVPQVAPGWQVRFG